MKYINYRPMPEDECGYCRICGEKTLYECDIEGGTKKVPICEECAEEKGLTK